MPGLKPKQALCEGVVSTLASRAVRGGVVTVASRGIGVLLRVLALIILARLVDPVTFGVVAIAQAIATFLGAISTGGLGEASLARVRLDNSVKNSLYASQVLLGGVLTAALFLLASPLASHYQLPQLELVVQWVSVIPLLQGITSQLRIEMVRKLRFGPLAAIEIASQIATLVFSVTMAMLGHPLVAIALQLVVQLTIQALLLFTVSPWRPEARFTFNSEFSDILGAGARIILMHTSRMLPKSALTPILGIWITPGHLGNFDRAQQLALQPVNIVVDQLQRVAVPVLVRVRDSPQRFENILLQAQGATTLAFGTGYLVLAAIGEPLMLALLGPEWSVAGTIFALLSIGSAMYVHGQVMQWVFISTENTRHGARLAAIAYPLVLVASVAGLPYGVTGVAMANAAGWALYWPAAAWAASRAASLSFVKLLGQPLRALVTYSMPVACCTYLTYILVSSVLGSASMAVALLAGAASAALLAVVLPWVRRDLKAIIDAIRSR